MRRLIAAIVIVATAGIVVGTGRDAQAADPAAEADFVARINGLRAANGVAPLEVHSVLVAKARAWAEYMAATGCLCHSNLPEGVTVGWRKLGENIGRGSSVASLQEAFNNSPSHRANMLDGQFRWIGVGVAYGGGSMYVAQVFMDGDPPPAPAISPDALLDMQAAGRAIAARPQGGFWVLDGNGTVRAYEGAPDYGSPRFSWDIARDIVAMPDGNGYAILDGLGGVHRYGSARSLLSGVGGPSFGWDIARSIALSPSGKGFAVLDGWGGVHRYGDAPRVWGTPYWQGWDIARSIAYSPTGGLYLLDGFGAVWATSGATRYGNPYFGWDIARDVTVWPDGNGYVVLDGFGGIHRYGSAKAPASMPWQARDRWRGITVQLGTYLAIRNDGYPRRV